MRLVPDENELGEDVLLRWELDIERARLELDELRQLAHRRAMEPLRSEEPQGPFEHATPPAVGIEVWRQEGRRPSQWLPNDRTVVHRNEN